MAIPEYRPVRVVAGVLYIVIGTGFLLESVGAWKVRLVDLWPLGLIAGGTVVLLGRAQRVKVDEDRSAQLAVAEERVRIARELHDIVAHSVSLMTIQIVAARKVGSKQPDAAERALAAAEQTGRQSLEELRRILAVLRGADASLEAARPHRGPEPLTSEDRRRPLPGLSDLEGLVSGLRAAGLNVGLTVSGSPPEASLGVGLAVYRVVQEALTNVIRHARAKRVEVEVTYAPDFIVIFVDDDGAGPAGGRTGEGHGLLGMRERVAAVGGFVQTGPRAPGPGWRVHARIPLITVPA